MSGDPEREPDNGPAPTMRDTPIGSLCNAAETEVVSDSTVQEDTAVQQDVEVPVKKAANEDITPAIEDEQKENAAAVIGTAIEEDNAALDNTEDEEGSAFSAQSAKSRGDVAPGIDGDDNICNNVNEATNAEPPFSSPVTNETEV